MQRLVLDGLRERWGEDFDPQFNPDLDDIWANYVVPGNDVLVIVDGEVIVATGTLLSESTERGRIVRMSVDASNRRRGLGRQMVAELIERARQRNKHELIVLTDTPWASAVALYRSCGFIEIGHDATDTHFSMSLRDEGRTA